MELEVTLERIQPDKFLTAQSTSIWLLPCVFPPVDVQVRPRRETFSALVTSIRPFPRMSPHVNCQRTSCAKATATQNALVPLLPSVGHHMLPHIHDRLSADFARRPGVGQPADLTTAAGISIPRILPECGFCGLDSGRQRTVGAVSYHVALQFMRIVEGFGTKSTAVRLRAGICVQPHVPLQRIQPDKFLLANAAFIRLFLRVRAVVTAHLGNGRKLLPAVAAGIRLHPGVSPHVEVQIARNPEPSRTNFTRVRLARLVRRILRCRRLATGTQAERVRAFNTGFWCLRRLQRCMCPEFVISNCNLPACMNSSHVSI